MGHAFAYAPVSPLATGAAGGVSSLITVAGGDDPLRELDGAVLVPIVQRAVDDASAAPAHWTVSPIAAGAGPTTGVLARVQGVAVTATAGNVAWSVVVKVLRRSDTDNDPASWDYWRREPRLYASGLLDDLGNGLAAPRLLGIDDRSADEVWLWLEDVAGRDEAWSLPRFAVAARHLGRMNGRYLVGRPLPSAPWLSRDTLRGWLASFSPLIANLALAESDPHVGRYCDPRLSAAARRLVETPQAVEEILDALRHLPQTFQHGDARRGNLITRRRADGAEETVALDWAMAGIRAVGEEIESLVSAASGWFEIPHEQIDELSDACFDGYLAGLRDVGWDGDAALVRTGYLGAATLRYSTLAIEVAMLDASSQDWLARLVGRPFDEAMRRYQAMRLWGLDQEPELRRLLQRVA